jgi:hypothetical protein
MNALDAARLISKETTPNVTRIPAFAGLPNELQRELQELLAPFVARGVKMGLDPVLPETMCLLLENRLFRVSVVTNRHTGELSIAILGPAMEPWDKETFLALLPDPDPADAPVPVRISPAPPPQRALAAILEELLEEIRGLRADLAQR